MRAWLRDNWPLVVFLALVLGLVVYAFIYDAQNQARKQRCREAGGLVVTVYHEGWACVDHDYRLIHVP